MRVAEHAAGQQVRVLADLRLGVQAAAGVVEVDVSVAIEPAVVAFAQPVDRVGRFGTRDSLDELVERCVRAHPLYGTRPAANVRGYRPFSNRRPEVDQQAAASTQFPSVE